MGWRVLNKERGAPSEAPPVCVIVYPPDYLAAAFSPAMRPVVKHIMMEVPEAGYSL